MKVKRIISISAIIVLITSPIFAQAPAPVNDGVGADIDFQSSTSTINANWADDVTEDHYHLLIDDDPTFASPDVDDDTIAVDSISYSNGALTLTNGTTYYVRIEAHDAIEGILASADSDGVLIDTSAPIAGAVSDGSGADIDFQSSATVIEV